VRYRAFVTVDERSIRLRLRREEKQPMGAPEAVVAILESRPRPPSAVQLSLVHGGGSVQHHRPERLFSTGISKGLTITDEVSAHFERDGEPLADGWLRVEAEELSWTLAIPYGLAGRRGSTDLAGPPVPSPFDGAVVPWNAVHADLEAEGLLGIAFHGGGSVVVRSRLDEDLLAHPTVVDVEGAKPRERFHRMRWAHFRHGRRECRDHHLVRFDRREREWRELTVRRGASRQSLTVPSSLLWERHLRGTDHDESLRRHYPVAASRLGTRDWGEFEYVFLG